MLNGCYDLLKKKKKIRKTEVVLLFAALFNFADSVFRIPLSWKWIVNGASEVKLK